VTRDGASIAFVTDFPVIIGADNDGQASIKEEKPNYGDLINGLTFWYTQ
jgi:hypothetical protein